MEFSQKTYRKREVKITMRDGIRLFTAIFEPKFRTDRRPIILQRTPYSIAPYGNNEYPDLMIPLWEPYIREGYIIVFQDVRGRSKSEGNFVDLRPYNPRKRESDTDEASDTYDTVEWLIHHTYSNERVGVSGISYPGFYAAMAMLSGHPAIRAVSPQAPVTDWFRGDDTHHNGAFFLQATAGFVFWFHYMNCPDPPVEQDPKQVFEGDAYQRALQMGALKNWTAMMQDDVTLWNHVMNHPNLDEWWRRREIIPHLREVKPAVMIVGGTFDAEDQYGPWNMYRALQSQSPQTELYLVEGPWSHGGWPKDANEWFGSLWVGPEATAEYFAQRIEFPFFAYYLEDKGVRPVAARVFQTGENLWKQYAGGWNPSQRTALYLHRDGLLSTEKTRHGRLVSYTSDPANPVPYCPSPSDHIDPTFMVGDQRFLMGRQDVVSFSTEILEEPLRMNGPIEAELVVSTDATDVDLLVKVIDVYPQDGTYQSGQQMLIRSEIMRAKYRDNLSDPQPLIPGKETQIRILLNDVAHTWLPGHRVMIQIQSSWFPLVDRNPQQFCDIYHCSDQDFRPCTVTLHAPSRVWLPIGTSSFTQHHSMKYRV